MRSTTTDDDELRFHLLGPLEVRSAAGPVPLRGLQQRSVLGFLLLHANTAVATSDLIRALWQDDVQLTARKMLQNAVAGVRAVLADQPGPQPATLLTHPPGYLLRVPPHRIDLCRFEQLANTGRDLLAEGEWTRAATTLREALELWRGPVLADLAETGITWPKIAVLQNARLAALEEHADAQLALGQHQEVVGQLEPVMTGDAQPVRERLSAQLMIALYRSGRQADALSVYHRTRTLLIEQLGLNPSRDLQELERAILAHDPVLSATPGHGGLKAFAPGGRWAGARAGVAMPVATASCGGPAPGGTAAPVSERKPVTVVLLRAGLGDFLADHDPENLRAAWQQLDAAVEEVVRHHGGMLRREAVGSLWAAWFGVPRTRDDDVVRAVGAAVELQRRLTSGERADGCRPVMQLAVASGEALVTYREGAEPGRAEVAGGALDTSLRLLGDVPAGGLRVCDTTRLSAGSAYRFARAGGATDGWAVTGAVDPVEQASATVALVERTRELRLLDCLLGEVRLQRRSHLATLLGEPGMGRTRLVEEFRRLTRCFRPVAPGKEPVAFVIARARSVGGAQLVPVLAEVNRRLAALADGAAPDVPAGGDDGAALAAANRRRVKRLAERAPLVLVFEDLHLAEDRLLDHVEDLVHHNGALPLFVLVTARPELVERRPFWAGGRPCATGVTLSRLSETGTRELLDALWAAPPGDGGPALRLSAPARAELTRRLVTHVAGNPRFAVEYVRHLGERGVVRSGDDGGEASLDPDDLALPSAVHRIIAAWLDALPASDKATLQDAAILGDLVCVGGAAAASGRPVDDVARRLQLLEARGFLRRAPDRPVSPTYGQIYVFRHSSVRQVAYAQLPRACRAERHRRVADWLERIRPCDHQLTHHQEHAVTLSRTVRPQWTIAPDDGRLPRLSAELS